MAALGAVQAQDYLGALWAIGLRSPGATETEVEQAIADRSFVRTWPLRGTLHFVPAPDVRWMLALLSPRMIAGSARRSRQLGLDEATFARSAEACARALAGGRQLTRGEIHGVLEDAGIPTAGQRGYHILWRLGQNGLICFGPRLGRQQTFVLLDEWVPGLRSLERDEALATLTIRYFTGHGPATLRDYVWWSGLSAVDARAGLALASGRLAQVTVEGTVYWTAEAAAGATAPPERVQLLPAFDEYLVGYRDRECLLDPSYAGRVVPGSGGMLVPTLLVDGRVAGTWKRTLTRRAVLVVGRPFAAFGTEETRNFAGAVERYARFLGLAAEWRLEAWG